MKKLSLAVALFVALTTTNAFANNLDKVDTGKKIAKQIHQILQDNQFILATNQELAAEVRFTFNKAGEIVVLSVATEDAYLESFVKGRLNYYKLDLDKVEEGKMYTINVRVVA